MSPNAIWYERFSNAALSVLAVSGIIVLVLLASVFQPRVLAWASFSSPPSVEGTIPPPPASTAADQEKRVTAAIADLERKAAGQQTLIGSLATLTGLYVVILSAAAYFRLQQTKDETAAAESRIRALEDRTGKDLEAFQARIAAQSEEFMQKVKLDIPSMHGIGRRLEELRIQLEQRLPVDGDWSYAYEDLSDTQRQQALVDEMVINSFDLFSLPETARDRRTICRLYCSLGQFYFGRASHLRLLARRLPAVQVADARQLRADAGLHLERARIYMYKAHEADRTDSVCLRELANSYIHEASWRKEDAPATGLDSGLLSRAAAFSEQSLAQDPTEPGACMGRAWLYTRELPPKYQEAIDTLSRVVDAAKNGTLPPSMARKYTSWVLFNRACYRARFLDLQSKGGVGGKDSNGATAQDLQEGLAAAKDLQAATRFRALLLDETDFDPLCQRDPEFAQVVAGILTVT